MIGTGPIIPRLLSPIIRHIVELTPDCVGRVTSLVTLHSVFPDNIIILCFSPGYPAPGPPASAAPATSSAALTASTLAPHSRPPYSQPGPPPPQPAPASLHRPVSGLLMSRANIIIMSHYCRPRTRGTRAAPVRGGPPPGPLCSPQLRVSLQVSPSQARLSSSLKTRQYFHPRLWYVTSRHHVGKV